MTGCSSGEEHAPWERGAGGSNPLIQTKTCSNCRTIKPIEDFSWRNRSKNRRGSWCKLCHRSYENSKYRDNQSERNRKQRNRTGKTERSSRYVWDYLQTHPCVDCGEADVLVLEFDHVDPSEKETEVERMRRNGTGVPRLSKEIAKCEVRCANCHRRKTAIQLGWWKTTYGD